jgi:hypothetical protein
MNLARASRNPKNSLTQRRQGQRPQRENHFLLPWRSLPFASWREKSVFFFIFFSCIYQCASVLLLVNFLFSWQES